MAIINIPGAYYDQVTRIDAIKVIANTIPEILYEVGRPNPDQMSQINATHSLAAAIADLATLAKADAEEIEAAWCETQFVQPVVQP